MAILDTLQLSNQVEKLAQVSRDLRRKHKQIQNQVTKGHFVLFYLRHLLSTINCLMFRIGKRGQCAIVNYTYCYRNNDYNAYRCFR